MWMRISRNPHRFFTFLFCKYIINHKTKKVGHGKLSDLVKELLTVPYAFGGITYEKIDIRSKKGKKNRYL